MQTKTADLMELFVQLFAAPKQVAPARAGSTLVAPMAELSAPPIPLTHMLSEDGSVLTQMLEDYARQYAPDRAHRFAELAALVAESREDFLLDDERTKRLLDFVYPVV